MLHLFTRFLVAVLIAQQDSYWYLLSIEGSVTICRYFLFRGQECNTPQREQCRNLVAFEIATSGLRLFW